ncbi:hypothetical protein DXT76_20155 [Halobacillus trueperi]|uniref:Uncharacterized protein n=2 Tax=Halobacillus TaxID=45667 RepID=A0A1H0QRH8_HALAD|nr:MULTISPECIES: hypothetical protein [Halobacillus]RDY66967.1 hypothetical protein DXT76_20155 [Halobacillus trueperi]SDP19725.1 hypothetical protein SAMN05421677_11396 [Halobacillus aidingensis]
MYKFWDRAGVIFLVAGFSALILPLFTDFPFRWELLWICSVPSIVTMRVKDIQNGKKVEPTLAIAFSLLMCGFSFYSLLFT